MKLHKLCASFLISLIIASIFAIPSFAAEEQYSKAIITEVVSSPDLSVVDQVTTQIQVLNLEIISGKDKGDIVKDYQYGSNTFLGPTSLLEVGDKVILNMASYSQTGQVVIEDKVRTIPMVTLFGIFLLLVLIVAGWHGLKSFLGLLVSIILIIFFYIPQVLAGYDPLMLSLIYGILIMVISLLVAHGITRKTVSALIGTIVTLVGVLILAYVFVHWSGLTGFMDEEIRFLYLDGIEFDFQGLLIGAMILGTLGVLDDVTVSQSSLVFELDAANSKFTFSQLFFRSLNVGRDHIVSTVNTLALAYLATSLPLLLLLFQGNIELGYFVQSELITTEIIRMLVGSIGIVFSIPFTNYVACLLAKKSWLKSIPVGHSTACKH